jgi:hypothetical protein
MSQVARRGDRRYCFHCHDPTGMLLIAEGPDIRPITGAWWCKCGASLMTHRDEEIRSDPSGRTTIVRGLRRPLTEKMTTACNKLGCRFDIRPGGHQLPEGALCRQCSEQLRRMTRRGPGYIGVAMKPNGNPAIFAQRVGSQMVVRGKAIE